MYIYFICSGTFNVRFKMSFPPRRICMNPQFISFCVAFRLLPSDPANVCKTDYIAQFFTDLLIVYVMTDLQSLVLHASVDNYIPPGTYCRHPENAGIHIIHSHQLACLRVANILFYESGDSALMLPVQSMADSSKSNGVNHSFHKEYHQIARPKNV